MLISDVCRKHLVTIEIESTLLEAAHSMNRNRIGALIVVDNRTGNKPVGILTDRDLALRGYGSGLSSSAKVSLVMGQGLATASAKDEISSALAVMAAARVRRLVIVNELGDAIGVVTFDDLFQGLAKEMYYLSSLVQAQIEKPIDQSYWEGVIL